MRGRTSRNRLLALCAAMALALQGCGDSGAGSTAPTRNTIVATTPTPISDCPLSHPQARSIQPESVEETQYLGEITACTDIVSQTLYLHNRSDAVWALYSDPPVAVDQLTTDARHEVFRAAAGEAHPTAIMAPDSEVVVNAPPEAVHFYIHPSLSTMWWANDGLVDLVEDYGEEQLTDLLAGTSVRRRALISCSLAAFELVQGSEELLSEEDRVDQLLAAFGIGASAATCRADWLKADEAALARWSRTPTWSDEVVRLADDAEYLRQADTFFGWLNRAWKVFRIP